VRNSAKCERNTLPVVCSLFEPALAKRRQELAEDVPAGALWADELDDDYAFAFALSPDSPAEEVRYRGKQQIQDLVQRGLKNNLRIEQSRDHRLIAEEANCWLLLTTDHLRTPAKGRAEAVVGRTGSRR
jgi:hypothetical protein